MWVNPYQIYQIVSFPIVDAHLVIYRPSSQAESWPKPDFKRWAGTGMNEHPCQAQSSGSGSGMWLPQSHISGFESWGLEAKAWGLGIQEIKVEQG